MEPQNPQNQKQDWPPKPPQNPQTPVQPPQPAPTVQPAVQPQTQNQPPTQQPVVPQEAAPKVKPPIAAQILYALAFLSLIGGLLITVLGFFAISNDSSSDTLALFGFSGLTGYAALILNVVIVVGLFYLVHEVRYAKKWALIALTTLIAFGLAATVYEYLTQSAVERLFSQRNTGTELINYVFVVPLLIILWVKNRDYFK